MKNRIFAMFFSIILSASFVSAQSLVEAQTLFNNGEYSKASEMYNILIKKNKRDQNLKYALAKTYFFDYEFDKTLDLLEQISQTFPDSAKIKNLFEKAKLGQKFLRTVDEVKFIDSVVVDKHKIISKLPSNPNIGSVSILDNEAFCYTTGKGNFKIFANNDSGNFNLFACDKFLSGWGEPIELRNLNTKQNENYPFLLSDGVTLYYASDSEDENLGGYDIFFSVKNSRGEWLKPQNAGMPFNSPFNDYFMIIDEYNGVGWFASDRYQNEGKVAVYQFVYNIQKNIIADSSINFVMNYAKYMQFVEKQEGFSNFATNGANQNTSDQQFNFPITDEKNYVKYSDFRSKEALKNFEILQKQVQKYNSLQNSINQKRADHNTNRDEKISQEILLMEQAIANLRTEIKTLSKLIRKQEFDYLQQQKK